MKGVPPSLSRRPGTSWGRGSHMGLNPVQYLDGRPLSEILHSPNHLTNVDDQPTWGPASAKPSTCPPADGRQMRRRLVEG